jgi:hypothetical protein
LQKSKKKKITVTEQSKETLRFDKFIETNSFVIQYEVANDNLQPIPTHTIFPVFLHKNQPKK